MACGSSNPTRVASPSAAVDIAPSTIDPLRHDSNAAGACSACTPITSQPGASALATMHAPAAPLPPPIGTMIASRRGSCSSASSVWVPTPAIRCGSLPEWT